MESGFIGHIGVGFSAGNVREGGTGEGGFGGVDSERFIILKYCWVHRH